MQMRTMLTSISRTSVRIFVNSGQGYRSNEKLLCNTSSGLFTARFQSTEKSARRYKILYDGDCRLCAKEIQALRWLSNVQHRPVDFVDISASGYDALLHGGVTYEMAMKEMHVIDREGNIHSKAEAIRQMYDAVGLSLISRLTRYAGISEVTDKMYDKFAQYRLQKAFNNCESGKCSPKVKQLKEDLDKNDKENPS